MANYVFAYRGGAIAATDEEREAATAAWGGWFGRLGEAVVDPGNPFGPSTTVGSGANGSGGSALSGYSVVKADSLDAAAQLADGCPVLSGGGSVDVYETIDVSV